jgi:hypothetical protein
MVYAGQNIPSEEGSIVLEKLRRGDHFPSVQKILTPHWGKITVKVLGPTGLSVCSKTIREI